ncbi:hypothetical protein BDD12DRAFT_879910 [Trichophaea hybrida]|nr:hypothetical protein BDD12DRAFT_879910 [Trichophaea hybrida]
MAPGTITWTDETIIRFLTSCAVHNSSKPNLDKVASEFGITSTAAYKKLWGFKKKYHPDGGPSTPRKLKSTPNNTPNKFRVEKSVSPTQCKRPPKREATEEGQRSWREVMEKVEEGRAIDGGEERAVRLNMEPGKQEEDEEEEEREDGYVGNYVY